MPHYKQNKELEEIAATVIKAHRPGLEIAAICYMFREVAAITDEKVVAGMCVRVDDRNYTIHSFDFVIEIAQDVWDEASVDFRVALMDHELGHVGIRYDEEGEPVRDPETERLKTYSKKHDIEEFEEVLERHGAYHKALREFLAAFARSKAAQKKKPSADEGGERLDLE